jgi:hypothetical protein
MGMIGNSLAQGLISGANIQDGTVDTPDIKDSAVTAAKIASAVITPAKLSTGAPTWDTSGNFGIGTSSPAVKLDVLGRAQFVNSAFNYVLVDSTSSDSYLRLAAAGTVKWYLRNNVSNSNALEITPDAGSSAGLFLSQSGNLGVGTTSPGARVHASGGAIRADLGSAGTSLILTGTGSNFQVDHSVSGFATLLNSGGGLAFSANGSERARISSAGKVMVNTTSGGGQFSVSGTSIDLVSLNSTNGSTGLYYGANQSTGTAAYFTTTSGQAGLISVSGNTTSYISGSDYRLKNNVRPLTGALTKVAALRPVAFEWKFDGAYSESFIAHELAEVFPFAVTGEKDAVNEDGSIKPQGIDTSFLVATLTAAIQEQQAIIESLTERITALETP